MSATARSLQLEFDLHTYTEELDRADHALGQYLSDGVAGAKDDRSWELRSPEEWRLTILAWCDLPRTKRSFTTELLGSTAMGVRAMDDRLLLAWVRSVLDLARRSAADALRKKRGARPRPVRTPTR